MVGWLFAAVGALAGTVTDTSTSDWGAGIADNVATGGNDLVLEDTVNEVSNWYRRTYSATKPESQAEKDDAFWFAGADRCSRAAGNPTFVAATRTVGGEEFRPGPQVTTLSGTDYLSTLPNARSMSLTGSTKIGSLRLLISGARIAQRDLTVRFTYSDTTTTTVVVPIPVDTVTGAARDGSGANYTRNGFGGLVRTANIAWDKDANGTSDCAGNGGDLVAVTNPNPLKIVSSVTFLYPDYDDASANTGWLTGPLAVTAVGVNYDALYTYRGSWYAPSTTAQALSAGSNAFFYQVSWNVSLGTSGASEIYIDLACADDTSNNGIIEAAELSPTETILIPADSSPYTLSSPCEGRYIVYSVELVDGFADNPALQDVSFTYDTDLDDDGYGAQGIATAADCNDFNPAIHPGATELVGDGIDQDCNGTETCYVDADGDGARSSLTVVSSDADCTDLGEAKNIANIDCDDANSDRYPTHTEVVGDDVDQDCDLHDLCYVDLDHDTYGSSALDGANGALCQTANSEAKRTGDCDDNDDERFPGNTETVGDGIDQDCNTHDLCYVDADHDTFGTPGQTVDAAGAVCTGTGESTLDTDCNDADGTIQPSASEIVGNNVDENCDASVSCYVDADDDGARTTGTLTTSSGDTDCTGTAEGVTSDPIDCADNAPAIFPGAAEIAGDNIDENCDLVEDCYEDADADGSRTVTVDPGGANADADCDDAGEAKNIALIDCNDAEPAQHPGAEELVGDSFDSDCDGTELCYEDADDDGARTEYTLQTIPGDIDCDDLGEAVAAALLDCDDANNAIYPGAVDLCNAADDDCNGTIDDGAGPLVTWHPDADLDTFGDAAVSEEGACGPDETWTQDDTDCDDGDALVNPLGTEVCNEIDDDCNDEIDEVLPASTWYVDGDGDGFGDAESGVESGCAPDPSFVQDPTDCDDTDAAVNPLAVEVCNSLDDDCSGGIDNLDAPTTWYPDADGDGLGVDEGAIEADCFPGEGWAEVAGDCDDTDDKLNETCLSGSGCGCQSSPGGMLGWMPLLGMVLAGIGRRRAA